jgi:hypothetical protein
MINRSPAHPLARRLRPLASALVAAPVVAMTVACGGGGGEAASPVPGNPPQSSGQGVATPDPNNCPRGTLSDAWINNRLGCLVVGQRLIDIASSASGARADLAFVVAQQTLDARFANVLPNGASRYFRHFICVRQAPVGLSDAGNRLSLATDLSVAIGTSNSSLLKPPQVSAIALTIAGGNGPGWVQMPCNPALHPVIVDFDSRLVHSLNPGALASLQVFDQ